MQGFVTSGLAGLLAGMALTGFSSIALADGAAHAGAVSEVLLKSTASWDGKAYAAYPAGQPEMTVLKITIPPKTSLPWHHHPVMNAAYVVSGQLTVEKQENGEKKLLGPGQVLPEMVGSIHRGTSGDEPVVLIVFYAGAQGTPLTIKND
jgi:quercetin dioxygenase-like cupin family protein